MHSRKATKRHPLNTKRIREVFPVVIMTLIGGLLIVLIQAFLPVPNDLSAETKELPSADTTLVVRIIAAGDAMAHLPQTQAAWDTTTKAYTYTDVFQHLGTRLKGFDLAIINLETTLAGEPYKGYPQFSAPDAYARDLNIMGFNLFCCANNHSVDRYNKGILRTIAVQDSLKIRHTGMFKDQAHRDTTYPLLLKINGLRLVVLNATYGTNGLIPKPPVLVNLIDLEQIKTDLVKARLMEPDIIMAVMHWGGEYLRTPDAYQKRVAAFLADEGVDVIIGHHPHVLQPIEWIKSKNDTTGKQTLVFWSLGNFFSNQRQRYRDGGMLVAFDVVKSLRTGQVRVDYRGYDPFWVWRQEPPMKFILLPVEHQDSLTRHYGLSPQDSMSFDQFSKDTRSHLGDAVWQKDGIKR
jgi:poly-gamma-glutamate capsule biosynthesis protein CapA/YwtB (metallophosphatase superfamily)